MGEAPHRIEHVRLSRVTPPRTVAAAVEAALQARAEGGDADRAFAALRPADASTARLIARTRREIITHHVRRWWAGAETIDQVPEGWRPLVLTRIDTLQQRAKKSAPALQDGARGGNIDPRQSALF